ncbi:hypothetical protein [Cyclobacterium sp.]|uniref:hypothetical protein n=1 Tax=Cyclobacterium sp. TaxID=1966343 RepID=UPI0019BA303E|nr:hypothetical protein [Cyclobacterium sp.]MBD3630800.1 hypothetical protein [Cyclobacterium sp.]
MKSKWLFLPDIFLVLLICMTCERNEMTHLEENPEFTVQGEQLRPVNQQEIKANKQQLEVDWSKLYYRVQEKTEN